MHILYHVVCDVGLNIIILGLIVSHILLYTYIYIYICVYKHNVERERERACYICIYLYIIDSE